MTRRVSEGSPERLGTTPDARGVNVAVFSAHATSVEFCLFDASGDREVERILLAARTGDIFHAHIADIAPGARYGFRAHGPYAPRAGHRFNAAKLLIDPYAQAIDRPFRLHPSMFGFRDGDPFGDAARDDTDSAPAMPKAIVGTPPLALDRRPRVAWADTIIYELHIRGFTKRHPGIPETARGTFAGLAHPAAIEHLTGLGVTAVEIMPVAAWIDERHLPALGLSNAWGYNPVPLLAPDPRLAPGGWAEIAAAAAALHVAGIEMILDVVLNHSGESDEFGPTVCYRGLDNTTYYRLRPNDPGRYVDDMGCGNCLALDRPPVVRLAMDALRTWVTQAGIDGFRFDLGTALGRRDTGFDPAAPLLTAIAQDPVLRDRKLIVEPWDLGPGGYRAGAFPADWGQWSDRYRDGVRRFWRGDSGWRGDSATRLSGSADLLGQQSRPSRNINFIVAHDGFTLADLVSYARKHNEANGEHNRDGTDANWSWNNGVEGPSDNASVNERRVRDQRTLLAALLFSRGTPMLAMGSEIGHSQNGNNNAYAQDNESSWLDWTRANASLSATTTGLIALRKAHPALRRDRFLTGTPFDSTGIPDVEWRSPTGTMLSSEDWNLDAGDTLVIVFAAPVANAAAIDRVIVIMHRGHDPVTVNLPEPRDGYTWRMEHDTSADAAERLVDAAGHVSVNARSVVLFAEIATTARRQPRVADPTAVDRLARAAGIAREWWDEEGGRHVVSNETKRALLAGLSFPAETTSQARESLARLADEIDRRPLPLALVARVGEVIDLSLSLDPAAAMISLALRIERTDGLMQTLELRPDLGEPVPGWALDGRQTLVRKIHLPPLPMGLYRVAFEDRPEGATSLAVVPPRCYLPESLRGGACRFGVSAQLYAQRRSGDQGIGDFTTLARLGEGAAAAGAAILGINPLNALFPNDRERASPYHPSDRRFLDPIYIDVNALGDFPDAGAVPGQTPGNAGNVDYSGVWAFKRDILERHFAAFEAAARQRPDMGMAAEFATFIAASGGSLRRFATFEAIAEARHGESWHNWPTELRDPENGVVADFAAAQDSRLRFHMFLQFLCDRQLAAAAASTGNAGLDIGLYRDLAVGAAPDGAEAWAEAGGLARGAAIGAPPDRFSAEGQAWNLSPPNPLAGRKSGYRAFRELIAANMRHAGALRIDHVMELTRLFCIPDGARPAEGTYIAYPLNDLLGHLALESTLRRCMVVGEDLGTVPDGLRETLAAADVFSYRVLWFERDGLAFKSPATYPAKAVACVSTHDLPTLAGWWLGADIAERHMLGKIDEAGRLQALIHRRAEKEMLARTLVAAGSLPAAPDFDAPISAAFAAAAMSWLARAPSGLALVQADDLAGETIATNLPGTDRERPNWRRRLDVDVEAIFKTDVARMALEQLRAVRGIART